MSRWSGRLITKTPVTPGGSAPNASAPGIWTLPEMAYWKKRGLWPDASADAYWGYVSYLMATSSLSNASNNLFVDSSGAFSPVSRVGNTTQGSVTPYGTLWSNYFPGAAGSYLSAPNNAAFQFGTGDLTIEAWIFISGDTITNPDGNRSATICSGIGASGVSNDFWFNVTGNTTTTGTGLDFQVFNGGSGTVIFNTAYSFSKSTWYHVAFTRSGNNVYLFVNGTLIASSTYSGTITVGSNPLLVGYGQTGSVNYRQPFFGYISNLRIVKGTALYTSAFTPSTTPLTAVSGTSILTCQSNRFRDASTNNFAITANGTTSVTPYSPFVLNSPGAVYNQSNITSWSGYFDGNGDYLRSNLNAVNIRTAFTIEGWVNIATTTNFIFFTGSSTAGSAGQELYLGESGGIIYFGDGISNNITFSASLIPINAWVHIACTFDGTTYRVFINGTSVGSSTTLLTNYTLNGIDVGARLAGVTVYLTGYISNFRVVKGTAVYTSAFTPPTSPLTAISGTSLLTLQNAAFTDNSTNNYVITPFGNVTVTGNNPYQSGYYSNYFDGSGDYLSVPNNAAFSYGTGDFTMEAWVYKSGSGSMAVVDSFTSGSGGTFGFSIQDTTISGYQTNVVAYTFTYTVPLNAWTHIAFTRTGGNLTCYVNGTSVSSQANSANFTSSNAIIIGRNAGSGGEQWLGYISNLRVVKGTAVYTGNFTPSTTPLTAVSGTSLLTCQANRLLDSSTNNFTITKNGDVSVQSFDPFYTATVASNGGSMYFDGSGDYLTLPSSDLYRVDLGDWTMEAWLYPTSTGVQHTVMNRGVYLSTYSFYFGTSGTSLYYEAGTGGWAATPYTSSSGAIIAGQWNHIAVVRSGTSLLMYANGNRVLNQASASFGANVTAPLWVGAYLSGSAVVNGNMTDVRFTKGTALYTGSTYTVPTAPLTPSANTTLLLNGMNAGTYDAAAQNNLETVGNAQVSSAQAKYGTTSVYFDGTGDYLTAPSSAAFDFSSGNFTIEAWVYVTSSSPSEQFIYGKRASSAVYSPILVGVKAVGGVYKSYLLGSTTGSSWNINGSFSGGSATIPLNTWTHIAVVRNGTTFTTYVNGVQDYQTTGISGALMTNTTAVSVGAGAADGNSPWNGYLDDVRITRGYARYTANFTPPTAALPVY